MARDRMRASDAEREETVAALRHAVAEGRLDMDEFTERTTQAYLAKTRGDLMLLLDDLPAGELAAPPPQPLPARSGFGARWRVPVRRSQAATELLEFVAPPMQAHGYALESRTEAHLLFVRKHRPVWTYVVAVLLFPVGLLALLHTEQRQLLFELREQGDETQIDASGEAPPAVQHAISALGR